MCIVMAKRINIMIAAKFYKLINQVSQNLEAAFNRGKNQKIEE